MTTKIRGFLANVDGATSIEYALIAVFISVLILVPAIQIGADVENFFVQVRAAFD